MKPSKSVVALTEEELEALKIVCTSEHQLNDGSTCLGGWGQPTENEIVSLLKHGFILTDDTEVDEDNQMFYYPTDSGLNYWNEHSVEKDLPQMTDFEAKHFENDDNVAVEAGLNEVSKRRPAGAIEVIDVDLDDDELKTYGGRNNRSNYERKSVLKETLRLHELAVGKGRFIPAKEEHLLEENKFKHPARSYAAFIAKYNAECVPNNTRQVKDEHGHPVFISRTNSKTGETTKHPKLEYVHREYKLIAVKPGFNGSAFGGAVIKRVK